MSNVRHSYWSGSDFLGGPKEQQFVDVTRQTAVVRVYGATTPDQEARIRRELHGQITQFWEACNTQHMLSQSDHSYYIRRVPGAELVYLNSAGQPQIIVRPDEIAPAEDKEAEKRAIIVPCKPRIRWTVRYVDSPDELGDWKSELAFGYTNQSGQRLYIPPDYSTLQIVNVGTPAPNSVPPDDLVGIRLRIDAIEDFYANIMPTLPFQTTELYKIFAGALRHSRFSGDLYRYYGNYIALVWKTRQFTATPEMWAEISGDPVGAVWWLAQQRSEYQTAWDFCYKSPFYAGDVRAIYGTPTWLDEALPDMQVTSEEIPCDDPPTFLRPDGTEIRIPFFEEGDEQPSGPVFGMRGDEGYWLQRL